MYLVSIPFKVTKLIFFYFLNLLKKTLNFKNSNLNHCLNCLNGGFSLNSSLKKKTSDLKKRVISKTQTQVEEKYSKYEFVILTTFALIFQSQRSVGVFANFASFFLLLPYLVYSLLCALNSKYQNEKIEEMKVNKRHMISFCSAWFYFKFCSLILPLTWQFYKLYIIYSLTFFEYLYTSSYLFSFMLFPLSTITCLLFWIKSARVIFEIYFKVCEFTLFTVILFHYSVVFFYLFIFQGYSISFPKFLKS